MPVLSFGRSFTFSFLKVFTFGSILVLFIACNEKKELAVSPIENTLFQEISYETTGVSFANTVEATKKLNLFFYMYFYNGGGVAARRFKWGWS
ncbi:hypothetical protein ACU8V7_08830 [Zobellia nedashkovskayae]